MKLPNWIKGISEDEAAKGAVARMAALEEIQDTRGFKLITNLAQSEIKWAETELKCDVSWDETVEARAWAQAWEQILRYIDATYSQGRTAVDTRNKFAERQKTMDIDAYHALTFSKQ